MILDALKEWLYGLFYQIQAGLCQLIDFIKKVFFKLCGLDTVKLDGEDVDIVSSLVRSDTIHRVFLTIFLVGVILLTIFVIVALLKANYQTNEKKGRGVILSNAMRSLLISLLIPFLLLAGMTLINTIMASVNTSMQQYIIDGQSTIGGQMLITTGSDAYIGPSAMREEIERKFLSGTFDYTNLRLVKSFYDIGEMNFVVGILGSLVMLVMFALSSITFVQRIFDIILLYIISPISISTIPLDEGNRFRVWKDMLIAKLLSCYGIIIVMNLFFLIMPQIQKMTFFDNTFQNGIVYVLFLIGGAFATTKANLVISQLTGSQAGGREFAQMIYNFRSGLALAHSGGRLIGSVVGGAIGGSAYLKNRKKGNSKIDSLKMTVNSNQNQKSMADDKVRTKSQKMKQAATAPIRLATMPVGVVKDMMQGGIVTAGKNFVPRLKNIVKGTTVINRAEVKPKPQKIKEEKAIDTTKGTEKPTPINSTNDPNDSQSAGKPVPKASGLAGLAGLTGGSSTKSPKVDANKSNETIEETSTQGTQTKNAPFLNGNESETEQTIDKTLNTQSDRTGEKNSKAQSSTVSKHHKAVEKGNSIKKGGKNVEVAKHNDKTKRVIKIENERTAEKSNKSGRQSPSTSRKSAAVTGNILTNQDGEQTKSSIPNGKEQIAESPITQNAGQAVENTDSVSMNEQHKSEELIKTIVTEKNEKQTDTISGADRAKNAGIKEVGGIENADYTEKHEG